MWKRLARILRCPACQGPLVLFVFREDHPTIAAEHLDLARSRGLLDNEFRRRVEAGLLACDACRLGYPVARGLPVLVLYSTAAHTQFLAEFRDELSAVKGSYPFPDRTPEPGERFVMASFSKEWGDYRYDGVLWKTSYQDQEATFLQEIGEAPPGATTFLEVGCGLGVMTSLAHQHFQVDAVGVDLSLASLQASQHYRENPFLHFVQASAFHLPFARQTFDMVYSRGVLHHTYSTPAAFAAVAPACREGGLMYLWVYGIGSIRASAFRRVAYAAETMARPVLSRAPSSPPATVVLAAAALGYLAVNRFQRRRHPGIQRYEFSRALHAARDRFTPRYAHRHQPEEVTGWFRTTGFTDVQVVDWRAMPVAEQENYQRNVGVRGRYWPMRTVSTATSSKSTS